MWPILMQAVRMQAVRMQAFQMWETHPQQEAQLGNMASQVASIDKDVKEQSGCFAAKLETN